MAISLGFGVLFATGIILLIVPSLYMIVEDVLAFTGGAKKTVGNAETDTDPEPFVVEATASK